jgi:hypothetical protein
MMMHTCCNPTYSGSRGRKVTVQSQKSMRPYLKNKLKKKGLALFHKPSNHQAKFKSQCHTDKKKKKKRKEIGI